MTTRIRRDMHRPCIGCKKPTTHFTDFCIACRRRNRVKPGAVRVEKRP